MESGQSFCHVRTHGLHLAGNGESLEGLNRSDVMSSALYEGHSGQEFMAPLSSLINTEGPRTGSLRCD